MLCLPEVLKAMCVCCFVYRPSVLEAVRYVPEPLEMMHCVLKLLEAVLKVLEVVLYMTEVVNGVRRVRRV